MILRASLANILNHNQARQADALAVEEVLVDTAWVDADTLFEQIVVVVATAASAADSIDGVEARRAVAVASVGIEYLIESTSIAFGLVTILYLHWWSAGDAVL